MEGKLDELLRDLGHALIDAIADSSDVKDSLRRIEEAGYSLHLTVDCKQDSETARRRVQLTKPRRGREPVFKINTRDLSFLKSIGIDPTRKRRPRR